MPYVELPSGRERIEKRREESVPIGSIGKRDASRVTKCRRRCSIAASTLSQIALSSCQLERTRKEKASDSQVYPQLLLPHSNKFQTPFQSFPGCFQPRLPSAQNSSTTFVLHANLFRLASVPPYARAAKRTIFHVKSERLNPRIELLNSIQ